MLEGLIGRELAEHLRAKARGFMEAAQQARVRRRGKPRIAKAR